MHSISCTHTLLPTHAGDFANSLPVKLSSQIVTIHETQCPNTDIAQSTRYLTKNQCGCLLMKQTASKLHLTPPTCTILSSNVSRSAILSTLKKSTVLQDSELAHYCRPTQVCEQAFAKAFKGGSPAWRFSTTLKT